MLGIILRDHPNACPKLSECIFKILADIWYEQPAFTSSGQAMQSLSVHKAPFTLLQCTRPQPTPSLKRRVPSKCARPL
eukprot:950836-Karenia_brevis.AAC.1